MQKILRFFRKKLISSRKNNYLLDTNYSRQAMPWYCVHVCVLYVYILCVCACTGAVYVCVLCTVCMLII